MSERWFYCLIHRTVEPEEGCPMANRLGPYASPAEAARALETARQRNQEWESDSAWNDDADT